MFSVLKNFNRFATLNAQYLANKSRNAVRFESQNISWDFEEANYQAIALSKGLTSLSFQKSSIYIHVGDSFLLRLPSAQQAEAYVAKLGTAGIGANLILSTATTVEEADN